MKIKKNGFGIIVSLMILLFLILYPSIYVGATGENGYESFNLHRHNYNYLDYYSQWNWMNVSNSYLFFSSGNVVRVEALDDKLLIENYSSDYHLQSVKTIPFELPVFGGFYNGKNAYYVMYGQENPNESDEVEVVRVVKYDKSWNKIGDTRYYGINTYIPFEAGGSDFAEYGNILYIRTCHKMYKSDDGLNHQANMTFSINTDNMTEISSYWIVMNDTCGYVSHSFNQYIRIDGDKIVAVDHGDAHPRSVLIGTYSRTNASEGQLDIYGGYTSKDMLTIPGNTGDNFTGVSVGGFEVSNSNYLVPVSRVYFDSNFSNNAVRNVSLLIQPKGSFNSTNTREVVYTSYAEGSGKGCGNPYLVKINSNLFVLMWEELDTSNGSINRVEYTGTFKAVVIDENGNKLSDITSFDGELSDCEPAVNGNTVCWYTTGSMQKDSWGYYDNSNSKPKFYELKLNNSGNKYNFSINVVNGQSNTESVTYTVRHLQEKINGTYESVEEKTYTVQSGSQVSPVVNLYEGFSSPSQQTVTVNTDGTVIEYRYERKEYNLTWNLNGGIANNTYSSGKIKYGSTIIAPNVSISGYKLTGWGASVPSTMPAKDLTFTAEWEISPVKYTVKYYKRTAEVHYEQEWELADTEVFEGMAGEEVTPEVKDYTGFISPDPKTVTISASGNTLVEYKYYRKSYKITWNTNGGSIETGITYNGSALYGGTFTAPSVKRSGYIFEGWEPELPATMPAEDMTFKAKWKSEYVDYTVEHYKEDLNGKYTIEPEIDYFRGKIGTSVTPEVRTYTGFISPSAKPITLSSDGDNILRYYYKRNTYLLTWNLDGGTASGNYTKGYIKYGEQITTPTVSKQGYKFSNWSITVPSTMPARAITVTAYWNRATDTPYKVEHYKQDLDEKYSTAPLVENFIGTTGMYVTPEVKKFDGYVSPSRTSVYIEADGSAVVKYYYVRAKYSLVWDLDGGIAGGDYTEGQVKFDTPITAPTVTKEGFIFDGWDVDVPSNMPAKNLTIKAQWIEKSNNEPETASYRVEHYKENLDGTYSIVSSDTQTKTGDVGSSVTPAVKDYTGFDSPSAKKAVIKADGSTVVEYKYTRKSYKLTWDLNGGSASGSYTSGSIKYGTKITVPTVSKTNYIFDGWDVEIPTVMPAENLTIKAQWIEKSNNETETASYRVEHYKENLDGTYSIVSSDTLTKIGDVGSSVTPAVKDYTGFDSPSAKNAVIKADGSTVVKYQYTRKSYKLTWDLNGGSASGIYTSGSIKYGTKITVPAVSKTNYIFDGWDVEIPTTMPAKDLTIKANWAEQIVSYTVKHFKENLDGSYSIVSSDTLNKTASAGSKVTPAVNSYSGFESPSERQFTIRSDGSTVAEYYYKRKTYVLTWDLNGGSASGGYTSGSVKYGAKITVPRVSKTNYIFDGWDVSVPTTMPAKDLTIKAKWAEQTVSYKVEHYQQNLDGTYTLMTEDTQILAAKAGSTVSPAKMDYPGFSASTQTVTVNADGSTVVQYKYSRNLINLTWNFAGGSSKGSYSYGYIKYGEKITAPTVTKKGYIFDGWDVEVPATMPAKPLTITAKWKEDTSNNNNNNLKHIEAKEPTCDKAGNKEYWYSVDLGKYYSDENGQNEIVKDSWVITALGHKWNNGVVTKEATETAEGTMLFTCERCSESYTDSIPAKGHEHNLKYVNAKAATCAKAGNSEYWYCDKCGKYYSDKNASKQIAKDSYIIAATGHKWDSGVVTKEATENAEGEKTFTCSICGETYTESIPKLEPANPVKAFVTRFYTIILQREEINDEEIEYYTSRLLSHELDGCSVAKGFVMSPEYIGKGDSDLDFVKKMYAAFFNREADAAQYYCDILASGQTREVVLAGFVNSPEFKALCADYGINPGELIIDPQNNNQGNNQGNNGENGNNQGNPSDDVTKLNLDTTNVDPDKLDAYVKNLYVQILGRQYDEGGLQYWKEQIMAGTTYDAATAARVGFFESQEYKNMNKTSEQFVTDCYHAFLGREPEPDGLSYWMNKLDTGEYSKQKVIDLGFGHSEEFKNILRDCGFKIIE